MPENGALAIKPVNISYEDDDAASVPNGTLTALTFHRDKGNIQSEKTVLINGASGSIGTAAVQLARYYGAEVTRVCNTSSLKWVKPLGAKQVIDYTQEDFTEDGKTSTLETCLLALLLTGRWGLLTACRATVPPPVSPIWNP